MNRLNMLHQYQNPDSLKLKAVKLREEYISTCMQYLVKNVKKLSPKHSKSHSKSGPKKKLSKGESRIERCLVLLKNFVEEFEERVNNKGSTTSAVVNTSTPAQTPNRQLTFFVKTDQSTNYLVGANPTGLYLKSTLLILKILRDL